MLQHEHPLLLVPRGMEKQAIAPLAVLGGIAAITAAIGGGAFAYNQLRRAWRGPEYQYTVNVMPSYPPQAQYGGQYGGAGFNWGNWGYAIPGAILGAGLGGLLGRSWGSAALGGLLGGGLGYFGGNYLSKLLPFFGKTNAAAS